MNKITELTGVDALELLMLISMGVPALLSIAGRMTWRQALRWAMLIFAVLYFPAMMEASRCTVP